MAVNANGAHLLGQGAAPGAPLAPEIHPANQEAWRALSEKREANRLLQQQVASFGMGLDPFMIMNARIVSVLEVLCPSETPEGQATQIAIEGKFETMMAEVLTEARRSAATAQLAAGAQVDPALLEKMGNAHLGRPLGRPGR